MKVRHLDRKMSLHRETVRLLDLPNAGLREAAAGARTSLCTAGYPHCDTVAPCVHG